MVISMIDLDHVKFGRDVNDEDSGTIMDEIMIWKQANKKADY